MSDTVRLRSPIGAMELFEDGVIVHTIDEGAIVDTEAAAGVLETTRMLADDEPVAVVVDLRNVGFADKSSRSMFASDPAGGAEVATALVASARVSRFLADLFLRELPARPTLVFEDVTAAREWAAQQLRVHLERRGGAPGSEVPAD